MTASSTLRYTAMSGGAQQVWRTDASGTHRIGRLQKMGVSWLAITMDSRTLGSRSSMAQAAELLLIDATTNDADSNKQDSGK